MMKDLKCHWIW